MLYLQAVVTIQLLASIARGSQKWLRRSLTTCREKKHADLAGVCRGLLDFAKFFYFVNSVVHVMLVGFTF